MDENKAKKFAETNFKKLSAMDYQWNILHSKNIINALEDLTSKNVTYLSKLIPLAWVHDIGKITSEENHAELGVKILEKEFELDQIERDSILNHGSSGNPKSLEAKIFRYADGLSLFYPEVIEYIFTVETNDGLPKEKIIESMEKRLEKYMKAYSKNPRVTKLLNEKYQDSIKKFL